LELWAILFTNRSQLSPGLFSADSSACSSSESLRNTVFTGIAT